MMAPSNAVASFHLPTPWSSSTRSPSDPLISYAITYNSSLSANLCSKMFCSPMTSTVWLLQSIQLYQSKQPTLLKTHPGCNLPISLKPNPATNQNAAPSPSNRLAPKNLPLFFLTPLDVRPITYSISNQRSNQTNGSDETSSATTTPHLDHSVQPPPCHCDVNRNSKNTFSPTHHILLSTRWPRPSTEKKAYKTWPSLAARS